MKRIALIRTDEKADDVNICLGEVVIGRGQLLKCTDKRISRNHGLIKLSEKGDVLLTSKHLNPVYYCEKMQPLVEIHSGNSVTLQDGDEFSLLPNSYRFRVAILSENKTQKSQNSSFVNGESAIHDNTIEEEAQNGGCIEVKQEVQSKSEKLENAFDNGEVQKSCLEIKHGVQSELENAIDDRGVQKTECLETKQKAQSETEKLKNAVDNSSSQCTNVPKCTRNLPASMTNTSENATPSSSLGAIKKERKRRNVKNDDTNKIPKTLSRNKKTKTDEISDEIQSQVCRSPQKWKPGKVCIDDDDNDEQDAKIGMDVDEVCGGSAPGKSNKLHELSDEEEQNKSEIEEEIATSIEEKKTDDTQQSSNQNRSPVHQNASPVDQNVSTNNPTRQQCLYGANCYRKNPKHRTDFSHPGDADYDDGNIPECPYGLVCYRKNKQHRLDYKHTVMPQQQNNPQNRQRKKAGTRKNSAEEENDDDEDDYDYDDPFLNDASSDDYQPTDSSSGNSSNSDGDDEEDTKRMLKEAKRFTRKKK